MTARTSEGMPARPVSLPRLAPPPVADLRIAGLLEAADDENAIVDSLRDGVARLRAARLARAEQATFSAGDPHEGLAQRRAGPGGGLS